MTTEGIFNLDLNRLIVKEYISTIRVSNKKLFIYDVYINVTKERS